MALTGKEASARLPLVNRTAGCACIGTVERECWVAAQTVGLSTDCVGVRRCSPREFQETVGVSETAIVIVMGRGPRLVPYHVPSTLYWWQFPKRGSGYELWGTGDARLSLQWAVFLCACAFALGAWMPW